MRRTTTAWAEPALPAAGPHPPSCPLFPDRPGGGQVVHSFPGLGASERRRVLAVLRSGYLKGGPWVARLEAAISRDLGLAACLATHTGALALYLALKTLGLPPGAVVAVPAYVCRSVVAAVRMAGLQPLLCDVAPRDGALDPGDLERRKTPALSAALVAHLFGNLADLNAFAHFGIPLIEDAAQCPVGAGLGMFADMTVFSFEGTKMLAAGEGGVLGFRNVEYHRRARRLLADGDVCPLTPTDLQGAVALTQWERRQEFSDRRRRLARRYETAFADKGFRCLSAPGGVYARYVIRDCRNVDDMIALAARAGIHLRRPLDPNHIAVPPERLRHFPVTRRLAMTNLSLPVYPDLRAEDQDMIISLVRRHLLVS